MSSSANKLTCWTSQIFVIDKAFYLLSSLVGQLKMTEQYHKNVLGRRSVSLRLAA